jgi:hypothetical protein
VTARQHQVVHLVETRWQAFVLCEPRGAGVTAWQEVQFLLCEHHLRELHSCRQADLVAYAALKLGLVASAVGKATAVAGLLVAGAVPVTV